MNVLKSVSLALLFLVCQTVVGKAQPPYPYYPYGQAAAAPPASFYDPYTSGFGPCPQRRGGSDPPCRETMEPSYGQPNYWPR